MRVETPGKNGIQPRLQTNLKCSFAKGKIPQSVEYELVPCRKVVLLGVLPVKSWFVVGAVLKAEASAYFGRCVEICVVV